MTAGDPILVALAVEVVGEGAILEAEEVAGAYVLRVVTGEELARRQKSDIEAPAEEELPARKRRRPDVSPKGPPVHPWTVAVPSGPTAEEDARLRLRGRLLDAHGRITRERESRAELEASSERTHGRHAR